jgi:hypothetical protein
MCEARAPASPPPPDVLVAARAEALILLLADRLQIASLSGELREAAVVDAVRSRELRALLDAFAGAGVRPVLLKGAALAHTHYSRPELRPRSDTDLMIPLQSRALVSHTLETLGYRRPVEVDGDLAIGQFHFVKDDRHGLLHQLDVHWRVSNVRAFADVLSYEELARDCLPVPALGVNAWSPSPVHSLLVACVHRVAHHGDAPDLLWLFDVHLLATAFSPAERESFVQLASERQMRAVCARTLSLAQAAFGGLDRDWIDRLVSADARHEPSAAFVGGGLRQVDILSADLAAMPHWRSRVQLLGEHLFPPASYIRQRYPGWPAALLPIAYIHRMVRGAPRWFRR